MEVEGVNLPDGTVVEAGVTTTVGTITLMGGDGELERDSQNGGTVSNGAAAVLAGVFNRS